MVPQRLVRDIAMHIAASNPLHVRSADVPEEETVRESEIYRSQAHKEGKPDHIADKIVEQEASLHFRIYELQEEIRQLTQGSVTPINRK